MAVILLKPDEAVENMDYVEMDLIRQSVEERGEECRVIDLGEWPGEAPISMTGEGRVSLNGQEIDVENVSGVYVRPALLFRPSTFFSSHELDAEITGRTVTQMRDYRGLFEGLVRIFHSSGATVCPQPELFGLNDWKIWQTFLFNRDGISTPDTLLTNEPDEVRDFYADHDRVIAKPVTKGFHVQEITDEHIEGDQLAQLANSPVQFQEYMPGTDTRVYVVDGEVVGAYYYRADAVSFKQAEPEVEEARLPEKTKQTVTELVDTVGLGFGVVDLVDLDSGDGFAVLEVNEGGRFAYPEQKFDAGISDALAEYLLAE